MGPCKIKQTSIATVRNYVLTVACFLTFLFFHYTLPLRDAVQTMGQVCMEVPYVNGDADKIRSANYEIVNGGFFLVRTTSLFVSFYTMNIWCTIKMMRFK
jgi:hypothetical protein